MTTECYALHGFLGLPSDWALFRLPLRPLSLWEMPILPFWEWARALNRRCEKGSLLLGYSLGARLALHALIEDPSCWKGAILISAHPGLKEGREARLAADAAWAKRFLDEPWETLCTSWMDQAVFKGTVRRRYEESSFCRKQLSSALRTWSLGNQTDLRDALAQLTLPILWIVGESDAKFVALADELSLGHPSSEVWQLPGTGHRAPWDAPQLFEEKVCSFISRL